MKINSIKNIIGIPLAAGTLLCAPHTLIAQNNVDKTPAADVFEVSQKVTPSGTTDEAVLLFAPEPNVEIAGETKNAAIVVDLSKNILYQYNEDGDAIKAYLVASGKKSSPTHAGIRVVTHVESYPYKSASPASKRRRQPYNYGPKIICLETVDSKTGERGITGEFIHGNNNPNSIGKYVSLGCIRMDNNVIKELSAQVKKGDIVLIKK